MDPNTTPSNPPTRGERFERTDTTDPGNHVDTVHTWDEISWTRVSTNDNGTAWYARTGNPDIELPWHILVAENGPLFTNSADAHDAGQRFITFGRTSVHPTHAAVLAETINTDNSSGTFDDTLAGEEITEVENTITGHGRWHVRHRAVYRISDGSHLAIEYNVGATEFQEDTDTDEYAYEVVPVEETITRYVRPQQ